MSQNISEGSYDYSNRQGIYPISWQEFQSLTRKLVEGLAPYQPQAVVGVSRAGLIPAVEIAYALRLDLYPVSITRRANDRVISEKPVWKTPVAEEVAGKVIAVVDEIASRGETLALVAEAARRQGAVQVVTASLVAHTWANPLPDVTGLVSDALVLFPWGRHVWADGRWQPHPEYAEALRAQGLDPSNLDEL